MIISVYFAKDADETWAFVGDYDEIQESNSARMIRFSVENPNCPVVIFHSPAKERLKDFCEANPVDDNALADEQERLYKHIRRQLQHCGISGIENAEIRVFIHFGGQSLAVREDANKKLVGSRKPSKFQCFAVSRHHRIPADLYPDDVRITPPRTEEAIGKMCRGLSGGDAERVGRDNLRAFTVLCQAVAALPKEERIRYLKGGGAEKWWKDSSWFIHRKDIRSEADTVTTKELLDSIRRVVSVILDEEPADITENNTDGFDISNLKLNLIAEVAAQKLRENQL